MKKLLTLFLSLTLFMGVAIAEPAEAQEEQVEPISFQDKCSFGRPFMLSLEREQIKTPGQAKAYLNICKILSIRGDAYAGNSIPSMLIHFDTGTNPLLLKMYPYEFIDLINQINFDSYSQSEIQKSCSSGSEFLVYFGPSTMLDVSMAMDFFNVCDIAYIVENDSNDLYRTVIYSSSHKLDLKISADQVMNHIFGEGN